MLPDYDFSDGVRGRCMPRVTPTRAKWMLLSAGKRRSWPVLRRFAVGRLCWFPEQKHSHSCAGDLFGAETAHEDLV